MEIYKVKLDMFKPSKEFKTSRSQRLEISEMVNGTGVDLSSTYGYLSPSTIESFIKCPKYFYWDKVVGEQSDWTGNIKMTAGSSYHKGMETLYTQILNNKEINSDEVVSDAVQLYDEVISQKTLKEFEELDSKELSKIIGKSKDNFIDSIIKYIDDKEYEKVGKVLHTENEFFVTINGIPFYGITDLETENDIIDFKFTESMGTVTMRKNSIAGSFQLWLYELAHNKKGSLHVIVPPSKRSPDRNLVNIVAREEFETWEDSDYLDVLDNMLGCIKTESYEKRGLVFGGCGGCKYNSVCNKKRSFMKVDLVDLKSDEETVGKIKSLEEPVKATTIEADDE